MMQVPTLPERILQAILLIGVILVSWAMVDVLTAPICRSGAELAAGDCYPWGFEGPFADFWHWRSRENYLLAQFIEMASCIVALVLPYVVRPRWITLLAMILLPIATLFALAWLPFYLGW